jgi:hypothetical protein
VELAHKAVVIALLGVGAFNYVFTQPLLATNPSFRARDEAFAALQPLASGRGARMDTCGKVPSPQV